MTAEEEEGMTMMEVETGMSMEGEEKLSTKPNYSSWPLFLRNFIEVCI